MQFILFVILFCLGTNATSPLGDKSTENAKRVYLDISQADAKRLKLQTAAHNQATNVFEQENLDNKGN